MHHHVLAVQDWGGSQERFIGIPEALTRDQAGQLVADMAEADRLVYELGHTEAAERLFGERVPDLISGNVCPGWEAMWIVSCATKCRYSEVSEQGPQAWGDPEWSPSADHHRHLTLVATSKEN